MLPYVNKEYIGTVVGLTPYTVAIRVILEEDETIDQLFRTEDFESIPELGTIVKFQISIIHV